jgi:hypothetical protein
MASMLAICARAIHGPNGAHRQAVDGPFGMMSASNICGEIGHIHDGECLLPNLVQPD